MKKNKIVGEGKYKRVYLPDTLDDGNLKNLLETAKKEFPGISPENIWVMAGWVPGWAPTDNLNAPLTVWLQKGNKNE